MSSNNISDDGLANCLQESNESILPENQNHTVEIKIENDSSVFENIQIEIKREFDPEYSEFSSDNTKESGIDENGLVDVNSVKSDGTFSQIKTETESGDSPLEQNELQNNDDVESMDSSEAVALHNVEACLQEELDIKTELDNVYEMADLRKKAAKREFTESSEENDQHFNNWLEELEEEKEFSDVDGEDKGFIYENEDLKESFYYSVDETDESEEDITEPMAKSTDTHYIGRNGYSWSKTVIEHKTNKPSPSIEISQLTAYENKSIRECFFDSSDDEFDDETDGESDLIFDDETDESEEDITENNEDIEAMAKSTDTHYTGKNMVVEQSTSKPSPNIEISQPTANHEEDITENNEDIEPMAKSTDTHYIGRNTVIEQTTSKPSPSIEIYEPTANPVFKDIIDIWSTIFDTEMVIAIVKHTNEKLRYFREQFGSSREELKDTNEIEMKSFIGLLYYNAVFRTNEHDANELFITDGFGHAIFPCVMCKHRFVTLTRCIRFDNCADRQQRLQVDAFAAVSWIFGKFQTNCQKNCTLSANTCIGKMFIPFTGNCKLKIHLRAKKPRRFGLKLEILFDAQTLYVYNAYINSGEIREGESLSGKKIQSVLQLTKPIENTDRTVTAGDSFSSVELLEILRSKGLTFLGKLKQKKREIPDEFLPNKIREKGSCLYGFTKDCTLLSYVPKKKKVDILLSSLHLAPSMDQNTNEPTMVARYNKINFLEYSIKEICGEYTCNRNTPRWPNAVFHTILDLACFNASILYVTQGNSSRNSSDNRRYKLMLSLARDLVLPSLQQRVYTYRLPRELRVKIKQILGKDLPPRLVSSWTQPGVSNQGTCSVCRVPVKRTPKYSCCRCAQPICQKCCASVCEDCI